MDSRGGAVSEKRTPLPPTAGSMRTCTRTHVHAPSGSNGNGQLQHDVSGQVGVYWVGCDVFWIISCGQYIQMATAVPDQDY